MKIQHKMTWWLGALSALALTACQPESQNAQSQASESAQKVYRVTSELTKFPVVMHDGQGGVSGFEAELLQEIAKKQGFQIEYNIDNWAGLLKKITSGETDILLGSVTITDERRQSMDFTESVLPYQTGLMVQPAFLDAQKFSDLRGKRVNLRKNTVYEKLVPLFSTDNGKNMVYPDNVWGQVKSLLDGESDAMVGASITLEYYKNQHPEKKFHIIYEPDAKISHYGWAVKKGNTELLAKLNQGLAQAKSDGTYDALYNKYW